MSKSKEKKTQLFSDLLRVLEGTVRYKEGMMDGIDESFEEMVEIGAFDGPYENSHGVEQYDLQLHKTNRYRPEMRDFAEYEQLSQVERDVLGYCGENTSSTLNNSIEGSDHSWDDVLRALAQLQYNGMVEKGRWNITRTEEGTELMFRQMEDYQWELLDLVVVEGCRSMDDLEERYDGLGHAEGITQQLAKRGLLEYNKVEIGTDCFGKVSMTDNTMKVYREDANTDVETAKDLRAPQSRLLKVLDEKGKMLEEDLKRIIWDFPQTIHSLMQLSLIDYTKDDNGDVWMEVTDEGSKMVEG